VGAERSEIKKGLQETPSALAEFLKLTGKGAAKVGLGGAGLFGLSKLLGLRIPGAFSDE